MGDGFGVVHNVACEDVSVLLPTRQNTYGVPDGEKVVSTHEYHFRDQQWLFARLAQDNGSYQGYLTELLEVWKAAEAETRQQLHDGQPPLSFAMCICYALIHTTIVGNLGHRSPLPSVYNNPPEPPLTTEALFKRMGELEGATLPRSPLETIAKIGDPGRRAEAFLQLAEDAPIEERESVIRLAVDSMLAIQEAYWEFPSYLWERLAAILNGDQVLAYAQSVFANDNEIARAWFISVFAKMMTRKMWTEALQWTFSIRDQVARAFTLRQFLYGSRGKQRQKILRSIAQAANKIKEPNVRSRLLVDLVGKLSDRQRAQVIRQAIATIPQVRGSARGWDAAQLLPYLSGVESTRFIEKVLSTKGIFSQLEAYLTLWSHLQQQTRQQAIKIALEIREPTDRANYLARIASKLRTKRAYREVIWHVANAILAIRNEDHRRTTILSVQGEVQDEAIEQVTNLPINRLTPDIEALAGYRFAFAERDPQHVAYALGNLSTFMDDMRRTQVLPLMVDLALEIDLHDYVAEAIEGIAPYLDEYHLNKALEGALQIGNSWSRVWALSGLAPFLKGEQRKRCLDAAVEASGLVDRTYQVDSWFDVDMAARLLPHLKGRFRERVLMRGLAAAKINDFKSYDARIRFLPYLDGERQSALIATILTDIPKLFEEYAKAYTLSSLAPFLSPALVSLAIQSAHIINDSDQLESALSALIPHLPDVEAALKFAQALEIPYYQAVALTKLLTRLSAEVRNQALQLVMTTTEAIKRPEYRIAIWLELLPQVENPDPIRQKVIEAILDYLWLEKDKRRNNILALCADQQLFSVNILPVDVLREIGEHAM